MKKYWGAFRWLQECVLDIWEEKSNGNKNEEINELLISLKSMIVESF